MGTAVHLWDSVGAEWWLTLLQGSFMLAFTDPIDAVKFCVLVSEHHVLAACLRQHTSSLLYSWGFLMVRHENASA